MMEDMPAATAAATVADGSAAAGWAAAANRASAAALVVMESWSTCAEVQPQSSRSTALRAGELASETMSTEL
tara:strand:+ start:1333 stop:1548 length:216 start_codon:yes stop_codon:yes gene_type:complete